MSNHLIPVKGRDDIVRDANSKALLRTDLSALEEHRRKRKFFSDMQDNTNRLNKLEEDMGDIKDTMSQILNLIKEKR